MPKATANTEVETTTDPAVTSDAQRVYNLCVDLLDLKEKKKASNAGFSEEIKSLEKEIEEIVNGEKQEEQE